MAKVIENVQLSLVVPNGMDDKGMPKYRNVIVRHIAPNFSETAILDLAAAINSVLDEQAVRNLITTKEEVY